MPAEPTEITNAQRIAFFRVEASDMARFPRIARVMRRHVPGALTRLYERIAQTPQIMGLFAHKSRMDMARNAQFSHWEALFTGTLGQAYFDRAASIGATHAKIGLEPSWYIGGYAMVLDDMIVAMLAKAPPALLDRGASAKTVATLVKLALLDMDLALAAYFRDEQAKRDEVITQLNETLERVEREEKSRASAVSQIARALSAVARNDFTERLEGLPSGFEQLEADYEAMRTTVGKTMAGVAQSVSGVNTGASEIRAASDDLALRTQQQAASLEEAAATMEQLTGDVANAARGAEEVTTSVVEAKREARLGEDVAREAVDAMVAIQRSAQEISKIIELIDGIAFQTNLVALNAGVEAVRAGDAGKGFAVVANEVRALAQRSAEAAREIKDLVTGSVGHVGKGVELVGRSGDAFSRIAERVSEIAERASHISELSRTQSASLQQVNVAVREMDQMTQHNAAMVEETTAAARSLAGEAKDLDGIVARFRIEQEATVVPLGTGRPSRPLQRSRPLPGRAAAAETSAARAAREDWSEF